MKQTFYSHDYQLDNHDYNAYDDWSGGQYTTRSEHFDYLAENTGVAKDLLIQTADLIGDEFDELIHYVSDYVDVEPDIFNEPEDGLLATGIV